MAVRACGFLPGRVSSSRGGPGRDGAQRGAHRERRHPAPRGDGRLRQSLPAQLADLLRQLRGQLRRPPRALALGQQPGQPVPPVGVRPPPHRHRVGPEPGRDLLLRRRLQFRQLHRRQPPRRIVPRLPAERRHPVHPHRAGPVVPGRQPHPRRDLGGPLRQPRQRSLHQPHRHHAPPGNLPQRLHSLYREAWSGAGEKLRKNKKSRRSDSCHVPSSGDYVRSPESASRMRVDLRATSIPFPRGSLQPPM
jgi:hypothetical protein